MERRERLSASTISKFFEGAEGKAREGDAFVQSILQNERRDIFGQVRLEIR